MKKEDAKSELAAKQRLHTILVNSIGLPGGGVDRRGPGALNLLIPRSMARAKVLPG